jgi:GMP synthase (glutamine-hydrolysing)
MNELILILDFGGQYKELISRTTRSLGVYSEIKPGTISAEQVKQLAPRGIILTGGPNSVYAEGAPKCDAGIFSLGVPVLGICYGMQLMTHTLGGRVGPGEVGEYGRIATTLDDSSRIVGGVGRDVKLLMSHSDRVTELPAGFRATASTANCPIAACENPERGLYAVQFHPESAHSEVGSEIVRKFLFDVCGVSGDWRLGDYIERQVAAIRSRVGDGRVLLGLSGGVDSSVCAAMLSLAVGRQLTCVFVDHGLMREGEGDQIEATFSKRDLNFVRVDASERFLRRLKGVRDPERKRKIVGEEFARVFEEEALRIGADYLAQGTIYPDIIESGGEFGDTIKSHHNVGGLPKNLSFKGVVEPLSGLFKDEVRAVGRMLDLPSALVDRQPFPGPGLSIRVTGEVTRSKLDILRRADAIVCEEIGRLRRKPQQYFAVLADVRSVGVKGDHRTYDRVVAVRAVETTDFMTCEYFPLPHKTLDRIASRITGEIRHVSRVVYDITGKPPATVEWE